MSAAGCSKSDPSATPEEGAADQTGAPEGAAADDATGPKLEAAIECINRHSNRVFEVRSAYMGSVDPATGAALRNGKPMLLGR